jgi:hypothetical protein
MKTFIFGITILAVVGVLTVACDGYDSQAPLMPSATLTRTSAPTLIATATSNHDPMNDFVSLDPATGVDDANEALIEGYFL